MPKMLKKLAALTVLGGVFISIVANLSRPTPPPERQIWDRQATLGKADASNHFVMYTDLACPYCNFFSLELDQHKQEFQDFLEQKSVLWELRVTNFLEQYGEHQPAYSGWGAEGMICAKRAGKFWEYYNIALTSLKRDYYDKGIGISKIAPPITDMTKDYWQNLGKNIRAGSDFEQCMQKNEARAEIDENTKRAINLTGGGVPAFQFNRHRVNGYDPNGGWELIKAQLNLGLQKR